MRTNRLLIYLCCVGSLWLASCSPTDTAPLVVTQAVAQASVTDTAMPTNTPLPAATPTVTAHAPSPAATDPAMPTWTREPSPTPAIQPTFTPIPGPVRPILFAGNPCPTSAEKAYCDEQWPESGEWYQINSDGSGLRRIPQLDNPEPYNYYGLNIHEIRFSPDGDMIAYVAGNSLYLADLDNNEPLELMLLPRNYSALMGGFDFVPEGDCLMVYWRSELQSQGIERLTVEQICFDHLEVQVVDVIELPDLIAGSSYSYLSAQGDALLTVGHDHSRDNFHLYITELQTGLPPLFVFSTSRENLGFGPVYWQTDGQYIEFILNFVQLPDTITITHYMISRDGQRVETILELNTDFVLTVGQWSPDGRQIAFALRAEPPQTAGIYIFDLETATWRHILPGFYLTGGPFWSPDFP